MHLSIIGVRTWWPGCGPIRRAPHFSPTKDTTHVVSIHVYTHTCTCTYMYTNMYMYIHVCHIAAPPCCPTAMHFEVQTSALPCTCIGVPDNIHLSQYLNNYYFVRGICLV